jgi:hypothetical protein
MGAWEKREATPTAVIPDIDASLSRCSLGEDGRRDEPESRGIRNQVSMYTGVYESV